MQMADVDFRPDAAAAEPIYLQLAAVLSAAIRAGRIPIGTRLPSERHYALTLGVSRTTVTSAYQELKAMGMMRGFVGRGAIVIADDPDRSQAGAIPWRQLASRRAPPALSASSAARPGVISFGDGWLHPSLTAHPALGASAARIAQEPDVFSRAAPLFGLPALHEGLIEMLRTGGVKATAGEMLVTSGAQQGLNVIARALITPGDTVVCESPTWYGAVRAFRAAGADVVGVGMDHEGVDPDALEDALIRLRPKFAYLIPSFQCPTGRLLGLQRRRRILEMCARTRTPIVESHVYGDITFADRIPALKSLDASGLVIFQGSASKTISPALRIGWLVAPPAALELLAPAKASLDLSTPTLTQATLAAFLMSGAYARHQVRFRDALRSRRDVMIAALGEYCPDLRYARPEGGLYLWAQLPRRLAAQEFEAVAAAEGVAVRSGDSFLTNGGTSSHIRLCFAAPAHDEISIGVQRMGRALRNLLQRHKASGAADSSFASV